jgi:5'-3' exoribonuclease 2
MGVPAFFRWLTLRYPKIVIEAMEELNLGLDINKIIENNTGDNLAMPSIDNLYFDMNGIIHPCAHPEDREPPSSLEEMFNSIFDYCDKIIRI